MSEKRRLSDRNARIAEMLSDGGQLKNFYRFIAQNPYINLHDACQIIIERPDASVCNSIDEWNAMGRRVNKGSKGIAYYDHDGYKQFVFDGSDTHGEEPFQREIVPLKVILIGLGELNGRWVYEESGGSDYRKIHNGIYTYLEKQGELMGEEVRDGFFAEGIAYTLYSRTGFPKTQNIQLHGLPYSYRENAELVKEIYIRSALLVQEICDAYASKQSEVKVIDDRDEEPVSDEPIIGTVFWCIFITAVGLTCIFTIVGLVKNMIAGNRNISTIVGKFFLALLGTMAMLAVVILGILIANSLLQLLARIFQVNNTTKLSTAIFNACVSEWLNGYSASNIDVTSLSVRQIFGGYDAALFGIWPTSWKCNGMVNPNTFLYLPALIAGVALAIALIMAVLNLAKRVYEIVFTYFTLPVAMSALPLDDGARFKNWREMFVTKMILAYGAVFAVNIFVLILPVINDMRIDGVSGFGNAMFTIFMIVGGAMLIPAGQTLFARLFGQADDMKAGGGWLRSAFYGGRITSALTIGLAVKGVKGIAHTVNRRGDKSPSGCDSETSADDGDKYSDGSTENISDNESAEERKSI